MSWWLYEICLWFIPLSSLNVIINFVSQLNLVYLFPFFWSTPVFIQIVYWRINKEKWMIVFEDFRWNRQRIFGNIWECIEIWGTKTVSDKQVIIYDSFNPYTCIIHPVNTLVNRPPLRIVWDWYSRFHKFHSFITFCIFFFRKYSLLLSFFLFLISSIFFK